MKSVLTIAGSDSSGGAGIQADIKTISANGLFAQSAITALTAQNTLGVSAIYDISPEFVGKQLDAVFADIIPDATKIGMVSSPEIIAIIAAKLAQYQAKNIVVDPVMVSTSGAKLIDDAAICALKELLIPMAGVLTPNLQEAKALCGFNIDSQKSMEKAAQTLLALGCKAVLVKGGHSLGNSDDVLAYGTQLVWFRQESIDNQNTHGTGCTLSSAIACNLAKGLEMSDAIGAAKDYITGALQAKLDLGQGSGPLHHMWKFAHGADL